MQKSSSEGDVAKHVGDAFQRTGNLPPVIDPTANVLKLVEASITRLDDLRNAESRRLEDLRTAETKRLEDLRLAENKRIDDIAQLRADYTAELQLAESKRIDAIRAVDVTAIATASERSAQQASVLANQVSTSAETLRNLVSTTAAAQAAAQTQFADQINERLASLERAQYKGEGRAIVADPALINLIEEVKKLSAGGQIHIGQSKGISLVGAIVVGGVSMLVGLAGMFGMLWTILSG